MGDIDAILTAITTVGFPIVCTIGMGIFCKSQVEAQRVDSKEMQKQFTDALNNNTAALTKLCEKLDDKLDDLK